MNLMTQSFFSSRSLKQKSFMISFLESLSNLRLYTNNTEENPILKSQLDGFFDNFKFVLGSHYTKTYLESENALAQVLFESLLRNRASMLLYVNEFSVAPDIVSLTTPASIYKTLTRQNLVEEFFSIKNIKSVIRFHNYASILKHLGKAARLSLLYHTLRKIGILFDRIIVTRTKHGSILYKMQFTGIYIPHDLISQELQQQIQTYVNDYYIRDAEVSDSYQAQFSLPLYILLFRDLKLELHLIAAALNYLIVNCSDEINITDVADLFGINDRTNLREKLFAINNWMSVYYIPNQMYPLLNKDWLLHDSTIHNLILQKKYPNLTVNDINCIHRLKTENLSELQKRHLYNSLSDYAKVIYRSYIEPIEKYDCFLAREFLSTICELNLYAKDRLLASTLAYSSRVPANIDLTKVNNYAERVNDICRYGKHCKTIYKLSQLDAEKLRPILNDLDLYYISFLKMTAKYVMKLLDYNYLVDYETNMLTFPIEYNPLIELSKMLLPINAELIVKAVSTNTYLLHVQEDRQVSHILTEIIRAFKISANNIQFSEQVTGIADILHPPIKSKHTSYSFSDTYNLNAEHLIALKWRIYRYMLSADSYIPQVGAEHIKSVSIHCKFTDRIQNLAPIDRLRAIVYRKISDNIEQMSESIEVVDIRTR